MAQNINTVTISETLTDKDYIIGSVGNKLRRVPTSFFADAVDGRITELQNDTNVLSARMDTFTKLEDGSTTGDAELQDIRVGADGVTYSTAGEAVREQINTALNTTKRLVLAVPIRKYTHITSPSFTGTYSEVMKNECVVGKTYLLVAETVNEYVNQFGRINTSNTWEELVGKNKYSDTIIYVTVTPTEETRSLALMYNDVAVGNTFTTNISVYDVTDENHTIDDEYVRLLVEGYTAEHISEHIKKTQYSSVWSGKNVLCIGDSITSAGVWQKKLSEMLGMNVSTHAYGGMGMLQCVKGSNDWNEETKTGQLPPLSIADVHDKDLIIYFAGYNNRGLEEGAIGDCYKTDGSGQKTIAGYLQFCINWIYGKLNGGTENGVTYEPNLNCRVMVVTPHCAGKYDYVDADGYDEYPVGSGRTMQTMAKIIEDVANYNSLPCYNAWENSGINRFTWCVYASSSVATSDKTEQGNGGQYYWNADQLHLNKTIGYPHLGTCIAKFVDTI